MVTVKRAIMNQCATVYSKLSFGGIHRVPTGLLEQNFPTFPVMK